jgi:hypothetical protein
MGWLISGVVKEAVKGDAKALIADADVTVVVLFERGGTNIIKGLLVFRLNALVF